MGYWYHYAIMFEALFILTTVDAGTRVARYVLQELMGKVHKPFGNSVWLPGNLIASRLLVVRLGIPDLYRKHLHDLAAVRHREPVAGHHRAGVSPRLPDQHGQGEVRSGTACADVLCGRDHGDGGSSLDPEYLLAADSKAGQVFTGYLDSILMAIFIVGVSAGGFRCGAPLDCHFEGRARSERRLRFARYCSGRSQDGLLLKDCLPC